jgi:LacI family repressor for deo operon, udp, cdd, tsx, nupC, and nupG
MKDFDRTQDHPPTIRDVAQRAGVATSTVSRALANPERVNARTRDRIERAASELGYVPSVLARNLSSGRSGTVALLVPDVTNPFYFDIIRGTQYQLKAAGYAQILVDTEESTDVELESLRQLRRAADGVILAASRLSDQQLADAALRHPLVTINRPAADAPTVLLDTPGAMVQAIDHLASLGHTSVAYVGGPATSWSNRRRWVAIREAAYRREVSVSRIGPYEPTTASGAAAGDAALNSGATAFLVFNDLIAIGMLQRFAERGVKVPGEVSIAGCDDIFGSDFCNPPLTTITSPIEQAGRVAVSMLVAQFDPLRRSEARNLSVLPTHLTVRSSTGPVPR